MKIIDISQKVLSAHVYEGDPAPKGERIVDMENGEMLERLIFAFL